MPRGFEVFDAWLRGGGGVMRRAVKSTTAHRATFLRGVCARYNSCDGEQRAKIPESASCLIFNPSAGSFRRYISGFL